MENTKKKKTLVAKILIFIGMALIVALFCITIAQTVKICNLNKEIEKMQQTYQSEATGE